MKRKFVDYYMDMASRTAELSYGRRKQVGAIVVKNNQILATGYNGTPKGWDNCCEVDGVTIPEVIHAEENCITKLARSTESSEGAVMFCTYSPCLSCAKLIHGAGISKLYYAEEYRDTYPIEFLKKLKVKVEHYGDRSKNMGTRASRIWSRIRNDNRFVNFFSSCSNLHRRRR